MSEPQNGTGTTAILDRAGTLFNSLGTRLTEAKSKVADKVASSSPTPPAGMEAEAQAVVESETPALARAEETMDRLGERLGVFAANLSHRLRKAAALAREEAEDVWAEAQDVRSKQAGK